MNDQDLLKLKTDCEVYKNKIDVLEREEKDLEKRVIELEKRNEKTDFQYEQIMKTLDKLNNETIPKLTEEIQSIKEKPVKRYEAIIGAVIGSGVGGVVGFIISRIFN